jgi:hypothetical protein
LHFLSQRFVARDWSHLFIPDFLLFIEKGSG